jgi:hypothetical protein
LLRRLACLDGQPHGSTEVGRQCGGMVEVAPLVGALMGATYEGKAPLVSIDPKPDRGKPSGQPRSPLRSARYQPWAIKALIRSTSPVLVGKPRSTIAVS